MSQAVIFTAAMVSYGTGGIDRREKPGPADSPLSPGFTDSGPGVFKLQVSLDRPFFQTF